MDLHSWAHPGTVGAKDVNPKSKFDQFSLKEYRERYIDARPELYGEIAHQIGLVVRTRSTTHGLDIGAGVGTGALLCDKEGLDGILYGLEPSDLHLEGIKVANSIRRRGKSGFPSQYVFFYVPIQGGIEDSEKHINRALLDTCGSFGSSGSFSYMLCLMALHEMHQSLGSYDALKTHFRRTLNRLESGGHLILADVQHNPEIAARPDFHETILPIVQAWQQEKLKHIDPEGAFIPVEQIYDLLPEEYTELRRTIVPATEVHNYVTQKGINLRRSPEEFYITTWRKNECRQSN